MSTSGKPPSWFFVTLHVFLSVFLLLGVYLFIKEFVMPSSNPFLSFRVQIHCRKVSSGIHPLALKDNLVMFTPCPSSGVSELWFRTTKN